jgi:hypothetical protein
MYPVLSSQNVNCGIFSENTLNYCSYENVSGSFLGFLLLEFYQQTITSSQIKENYYPLFSLIEINILKILIS